MKDHGLVSIIMPNWNCETYVGETIHSVQSQSYQNWELIIIDDCSTDSSCDVIESFAEKDGRIKLLRNSKNLGAAESRNLGLREAKGKWIAFLDSDDLWLPNKLEKQLEFMDANGYDYSYTRYCEIDSHGDETGVMVAGPKRVSRLAMFAFCWPGCLTVMYNRDAIGLVQIADIKKNNDYAMWLQVCQKSDCYLLDECLAKYRRGRIGSVSTNGYSTLILWHYKLWHDAMLMNMVTSLFWTTINIIFGLLKKLFFVKKYNPQKFG